MTKRALRKALLPLLLLATVAVVATTANAAQGPKVRDSRSVWEDIQSGKAPRVPTPPERQVSWAAVWNGCKFVYLKSDISSYRTQDGIAEVSENPEPMPPRGPDCVEREPTADEIRTANDQATLRNSGFRSGGLPNPPESAPTPRVPRTPPR